MDGTRTVGMEMAPDLTAPTAITMRILMTAVAAIAALSVVALGVKIGTDGLSFGADRNPAVATATPAASLVDLPRSGSAEAPVDLLATLRSLLPPVQESDPAVPAPTQAPAAPAAPAADPAPAPAPAPAPTPVPVPVPAPVTVSPPAMDVLPPVAPVVVEAVEDLLDGLCGVLGV